MQATDLVNIILQRFNQKYILKIFKKTTGSLNRSNSFYFWQHVYEFEFFRSVYFIDPKRNRFMSDTGFMNEMTYGGIKSSDVLIKGHTNLSVNQRRLYNDYPTCFKHHGRLELVG